ncbi:hypothetical protein [Pseudoalteromonas sp. Of7M-16]|uniref:hypothetical protein n=1 Tax=Pseudoalteromonas sp. Of7M-16 TaxID=2917756 RepID=UPI001EF48620|nr:hypothetical protein [Pseudoalteromonas sp. Of7M-16]MCG7550921.1 hypothetical protein [Pseudoalteromonas sp. Of7M-16]
MKANNQVQATKVVARDKGVEAAFKAVRENLRAMGVRESGRKGAVSANTAA